MRPERSLLISGMVIFGMAVAAAADLHRVEVGSITVYTTPALRDLLEKGVFPLWQEKGHLRVEPVYVAAGQEYNRLRMSGAQPEADLFLHASPLFLEKGFDQGYFLPLRPEIGETLDAPYRSNSTAQGNSTAEEDARWYAWAWSPLVEVYSSRLAEAPDLATAQLRYGLAHPTLSNNGIYTVLFLERISPAAGEHALRRTVIQPVNARSNILGVADGSFDVTLGYEAVAEFFHAQGARIAYAAPLVEGNRTTTPVLFCVGLVDGPHPEEARAFVDLLFTNETQALLPKYYFRSVYNLTAPPSELPPDTPMVQFDWQDWEQIERLLPRYEVVPGYG